MWVRWVRWRSFCATRSDRTWCKPWREARRFCTAAVRRCLFLSFSIQDYLRATIEAKTATSDKISLRASAGLEVRRYSGDAPLPSTATTAAAAAPLPVVGQSVAVQTATGETLPGQVVGVQTLAGDPVSSGTVARESTEILPVGSISLDYRPTQNTTVTLSAYTDLGSSSIYTGRSRVDTGALITLNQRLLGKLSLNLSAGYEFYTYGGFDVGARQETPTVVVQQVAVTTADGRQEIIEQSSVQAPAPTSDSDDKIDQSEGSYFFIRAGLTWTIRPWCSLSAFYEYMSEDASALYGTTGDYTRNRAVLQLALQL